RAAPRLPATVRVAGASSPSPTRHPSRASRLRGTASRARPAYQRSTPAAWRAAAACTISGVGEKLRRRRVHGGIRPPFLHSLGHAWKRAPRRGCEPTRRAGNGAGWNTCPLVAGKGFRWTGRPVRWARPGTPSHSARAGAVPRSPPRRDVLGGGAAADEGPVVDIALPWPWRTRVRPPGIGT